MWLLILIGASYIIGSVPTSILVGKLLRGIDIRDYGSRNPGATNTFRVLGKEIGIAVGIIDIFKGFFAVSILTGMIPGDQSISREARMLAAGLAVVAGHIWTVFAGFRGGKGVGTAFGAFLALAPIPSLIALTMWCAVTFTTGYVSLGSITAAMALPAAYAVLGFYGCSFSRLIAAVLLLVGIIIIIRHKSNISRLLKGEENRFGKRGKQ